MKSHIVIALVVAFALLAFSLRAQSGAPVAPASPSATTLGRYQIVILPIPRDTVSPGEVWMVDSVTGDTWSRRSDDGKWTHMGNPTLRPGR